MALQGKFESEDQIPEGIKEHYTQQGDSWVLDVSDLAPKQKLNEFRDRNIQLMKEMDALKASTSGVDPEEYKALKANAQRLKEKKLIEADKIDEVFNERLAPLKAEHERQIKEYQSKTTQYESELSRLLIDNEIRAAASKVGARATAVDDLILRGHQVFKYQDGKVLPLNGDQIAYGKSGEPLSIAEWMGTLSDKAPHLFESSNGGGASKSGGSMPISGGNKVSRNDPAAFLANLDAIASGKKQVI